MVTPIESLRGTKLGRLVEWAKSISPNSLSSVSVQQSDASRFLKDLLLESISSSDAANIASREEVMGIVDELLGG